MFAKAQSALQTVMRRSSQASSDAPDAVQAPMMQAQTSLNAAPLSAAPRQRNSARQMRPPQMQHFAVAPELPAGKGFEDDDALEPLEPLAPSSAEPEPEAEAVAGSVASGAAESVLTVSTRVEYSSIARAATRDVFGLVTVQAADVVEDDCKEKEERRATDIVCALDVSGSMSGEKLMQLQAAVRFVISQATAKDRLSLVAFNGSASRVLPLKRMTAEGKDEANLATLRLVAGGGTRIAAGLDVALQVLEQRRQRNDVSAVLLLTDGQDSSTRQALPALLARASRSGSSLYCFGFGRDHDAALLGEIAEQARTPFTFVEDPECIQEAFAGAVGGLSSVVAQQVELILECQHRVKALHTPFAVTRGAGAAVERATVTIPDLFAGERRDVLVELAVDASSESSGNLQLLTAQLRYRDLRSKQLRVTPVCIMQAEVAATEQPEAEPDEEVAAQRERVQVTAALQEAAACGDRGDFGAAQELLQNAEQQLESRPKAKRGKMCEALGLELADARQRMASRSSWEQGGRAELKDAVQMYSVQRCTNAFSSKEASCKKSKALFVNRKQSSMISKLKSG